MAPIKKLFHSVLHKTIKWEKVVHAQGNLNDGKAKMLSIAAKKKTILLYNISSPLIHLWFTQQENIHNYTFLLYLLSKLYNICVSFGVLRVWPWNPVECETSGK